MQNTCKCCVIHPKQQSTNVDSLEKRKQEREEIWGDRTSDKIKVELIEWRSLDLHSINSKSIFHPPQGSKHMGTYSACILGVRLRYQRHGKHIY